MRKPSQRIATSTCEMTLDEMILETLQELIAQLDGPAPADGERPLRVICDDGRRQGQRAA